MPHAKHVDWSKRLLEWEFRRRGSRGIQCSRHVGTLNHIFLNSRIKERATGTVIWIKLHLSLRIWNANMNNVKLRASENTITAMRSLVMVRLCVRRRRSSDTWNGTRNGMKAKVMVSWGSQLRTTAANRSRAIATITRGKLTTTASNRIVIRFTWVPVTCRCTRTIIARTPPL